MESIAGAADPSDSQPGSANHSGLEDKDNEISSILLGLYEL